MSSPITYTYKGYRIKKYGTRKIFYKIFRPSGGSLNYSHYDTLKTAKDEVDRAIARSQKGMSV